MRRDELIENNLGLVHSCANRFRNKGIEYDDLYSAGCLGLVKAADGFKPELGFAFSTYAVPAILGEIRRLFRDGGAVKVSRSLKEKSRLLHKEKEKLTNSLEREPTISEIAECMDIDECEAIELLNVSMPPMSLTATNEDGERQIDVPIDSPENEIQNTIALNEVLSKLTDEDRKLIELRYYKGLTQTNTAKLMGISQVQVSRKERTILISLRRKMTG
ncbi:MAG: sigma-70 family RNA polymerase sigma factor [Oscillospiraceae bacterium]